MNKVEQITRDQILYEDEDIIVLEKVAGFPVQSAKFGQKDMESSLKNYLALQQQGMGITERRIPYVGVVHRLDQPVEGIVVFAKTPQAAKELSGQLAKGMMKKRYKAVVILENPGQTMEHLKDIQENEKSNPKENINKNKEVFLMDYLLKDGRSNTSKVVKETTANGKLAKLSYHFLEIKEPLALVEITLQTGRHHQIRVQMAHHHLPLWGDSKYNPHAMQEGGWEQIALCAFQLEFKHPRTKKNMKFSINPKGQIFHRFSSIS